MASSSPSHLLLQTPLPPGANEQNICGQNSALERSNLRGGGDISHSKLRAMPGSESGLLCIVRRVLDRRCDTVNARLRTS